MCSTASTTMIASSTTMPIARTSASSEMVLAENPSASMTKGADEGDRHRDDRNQGRPHTSEKDEDDDADEDKGFEQRLFHLMDHRLDKDRRVVHHVIGDVFGEAGLHLLQRFLDPGAYPTGIVPAHLDD